MASGYYPAGAENDPRAPWNEYVNEDIEVDVEVILTLSKKIKIITNDYERDEDGYITEWGDLKEEARRQIEIPKGWEEIDMDVEY